MFPSLIKRSKTHFHNLPIGASIILGNNGFIWICPPVNNEDESVGGFVQNLEEVIMFLESYVNGFNIDGVATRTVRGCSFEIL